MKLFKRNKTIIKLSTKDLDKDEFIIKFNGKLFKLDSLTADYWINKNSELTLNLIELDITKNFIPYKDPNFKSVLGEMCKGLNVGKKEE